MSEKEIPPTTEGKLEEILVHMRKMDARDRLRTWGGFFRSLISFIPIIILVWSTWYFFVNGDKFMEKITDLAAQKAKEVSEEQAGSMTEQLRRMLEQ